MITLFLARHGETVDNAAHILQGQLPGKLSHQGIEQAKDLALELKDTTFEYIISSDLARCVHTADIINEGRGIPHIQTPLLRERDWGSFTGKAIAEIKNLPVPKDVETMDELLERAKSFINFIKNNYAESQLLAVGHGLINRAIQAYIHQQTMSDIEPMKNAEVRILYI